ncbi:MAG: hypothetical protein H7Z41_09875, partial [Cytophagales bacterium]|nr:hypothetical protein [Armatimonadota bacterium]
MHLLKNRREFLLLAAATPFALLEGCAKVPSSDLGSNALIRYATVRMRVAGRIRQTAAEGPACSYYFLLNFVDDINLDAGPAPVTGLPWGNG